VVTVLENTIGDIVWTRIDAGTYHGTLAGAFPDINKLYLMINQIDSAQGVYYMMWYSIDAIQIDWFDFSSTQLDSTLQYNTIEIRVYP
jgi:hypothetical protein